MSATFVEMEAELHAMASQVAGDLTDFGRADEYLPGLRQLLAAIDAEQRYTPSGRPFVIGVIVGTLAARLHTEHGWKQRPDYSDVAIRRPLVITGIPRTGTTALHKLLSMDPQFQGLERWVAESPQVRPPRERWSSNPWFQMSVANLDSLFAAMPEMRKAHDMVADEVDECLEILRQNFISNRFGASLDIPSYDRWWHAQSELPSYRRYVDVLRLVGADDRERQWLLKNPGHVAEIDCLLDVLPDACVIQTHRDPVQAIASISSLLLMSRQMMEGERTRAEVIGERELEYWGRAMEKMARVRQTRPDQFHDVDHRQFHREPMRVVRGIYDRFGLSLSDEAAQRMQRWIVESPTSKHGEHRYDIAAFGITSEQVRERFADYIARYSLD